MSSQLNSHTSLITALSFYGRFLLPLSNKIGLSVRDATLLSRVCLACTGPGVKLQQTGGHALGSHLNKQGRVFFFLLLISFVPSYHIALRTG